VNRTAAATALVDGDNGMGHLVVSRAMESAIEMAREAGVAWVGIRMSNHAGAAGVYAAMALEAQMIGMYAAVASANHMPLAGGAEPLLGTNPLAMAIPAGKEAPVVLDIATSVVSYGTIKNHRLQGRALERDWMVDPATGAPITDPAKSMEGLLLPLGGYKGAGLALMLGLLGGTLNRAPFGRDVIDFNAHPDALTNTGQFVVALDVKRFQPFDDFSAEVDRQSLDLRASKTLPGHDAVRLPGEQRAKRRAERVRDGLPLAGELVAQLDKVAGELGIRTLGVR
jgi:LDH2 family malate/lactate/ureidoglycolate dehydrogenase